MSSILTHLLLWLPFLLVASITAIIFCISGYRKGLWRALIALGAVLVSALISMALSSLLSGVLSVLITQLLESLMGSRDAYIGSVSLVTMFLSSVSSLIACMVCFFLLMFLFTTILRHVAYGIKRKKLVPTGKGLKFAGMAVGLAATLLFTFLWLMPFYGSLAAGAPLVDTLLTFTVRMEQVEAAENEQYGVAAPDQQSPTGLEEVLQVVRSACAHPLVRLYDTAPARLTYGGMARVSAGDTSFSIADATSSVEKLLDIAARISEAEEEELPALYRELLVYLRDDAIPQQWCYAMFQECVNSIRSTAEEMTAAPQYSSVEGGTISSMMVRPSAGVYYSEEDRYTGKVLIDLADTLDVSQKDFVSNMENLLDFLIFAMDNGLDEILNSGDITALSSSGILERSAALANSTKEAKGVKECMVMIAIGPLVDYDYDAAKAYIAQHPLELTDPADQQQEALAFFSLLFLDSSDETFITLHPALGE